MAKNDQPDENAAEVETRKALVACLETLDALPDVTDQARVVKTLAAYYDVDLHDPDERDR